MKESTLERIKNLAEDRRTHLQRLAETPSGLAWCQAHSRLIDQAIEVLIEDASADQPAVNRLAVIATGGYGRMEMAPYSDIDVTVVPPEEASPELDRAIRTLFQDLHTAFGTVFNLGVGYAYRLIADAPGLDAKTRTGLTDARLLHGPASTYQLLMQALDDTMSAGEFLLSKIAERERAYRKFHDTPLVVEPQLKEGAGGLRCFHCANWIKNAIGEREAKPGAAFDYVVQVRNLLHFVAGKHFDLLTHAKQAELADLLNRDPFKFMSEILNCTQELHREFLDARERLCDSRFSLSRTVQSIRGEARITPNSDAGESAIGISIAAQLGLKVSDQNPHPSERVSGAAAAHALSSGIKTLRNLDHCGLLAYLLPELTRCRTLMPRDTVHRYTVFEHTLRLVDLLENLPPNSFLVDIRDQINNFEPLYLSALLHDVGKIDSERSHSEYGAELAAEVCDRFHLSADLKETIVWLVREHLTMMRFVRLRDLQNPETVREFAGLLRSPNRLNLLTLLTWADVNAVSPEAWSPAQDAFLQELYRRTLDALEQDKPPQLDVAQQRQRLMRQLKEDIPDEDLRRFVDSLPPYYLSSTDPKLMKLHYSLVRKAEHGEPTVESFDQPEWSATDITVCTSDQPGLLSRILGVLYAFDLSVTAIRACTTESQPPVALDTFTVTHAGNPVPAATRASLSSSILAVITGQQTVDSILQSRGKDPDRSQEVFSFTFTPGVPGVLEVRAPRGRGMPYRFSRLIASQGWNTYAARVGQWADSGAATFYIAGPSGRALSRQEIESTLRPIRTA